MRPVVTSALAFFLSLFAGGIVAQQLAVSTGAQEGYILVFIATVLVAIIVTIPFFIAQYRPEQLSAVGKVAGWLMIIFVVLLAVLAGWAFMPPPAMHGNSARTFPSLLGWCCRALPSFWCNGCSRAGACVALPRFGRGSA
jgi:amino acid transporter